VQGRWSYFAPMSHGRPRLLDENSKEEDRTCLENLEVTLEISL
jgi:hypothetical protein